MNALSLVFHLDVLDTRGRIYEIWDGRIKIHITNYIISGKRIAIPGRIGVCSGPGTS